MGLSAVYILLMPPAESVEFFIVRHQSGERDSDRFDKIYAATAMKGLKAKAFERYTEEAAIKIELPPPIRGSSYGDRIAI
jgi:hypothetical protein